MKLSKCERVYIVYHNPLLQNLITICASIKSHDLINK